MLEGGIALNRITKSNDGYSLWIGNKFCSDPYSISYEMVNSGMDTPAHFRMAQNYSAYGSSINGSW